MPNIGRNRGFTIIGARASRGPVRLLVSVVRMAVGAFTSEAGGVRGGPSGQWLDLAAMVPDEAESSRAIATRLVTSEDCAPKGVGSAGRRRSARARRSRARLGAWLLAPGKRSLHTGGSGVPGASNEHPASDGYRSW